MSILSKIFGGATAQPVEAVMKGLDGLFTSDEEKLDKKALLERIAQEPGKIQAEINKIEAQHRSIFVAGWRPFIGWVCGSGLAFVFLLNPIIQWLTNEAGPALPMDAMTELVIALLGLGGLRTLEKFGGRTK